MTETALALGPDRDRVVTFIDALEHGGTAISSVTTAVAVLVVHGTVPKPRFRAHPGRPEHPVRSGLLVPDRVHAAGASQRTRGAPRVI